MRDPVTRFPSFDAQDRDFRGNDKAGKMQEQQPIQSQPVQPQAQAAAAEAIFEDIMPRPKPTLAHHFIVVLFLLVFPPVSFYIMWKYKAYHGWFASICWISGVFLLIYTLVINFGVVPQMQKIIMRYGRDDLFVQFDIRYFYLLLAISVLQIVYGLYLRHKFKNRGYLPRLDIVLSMIILAFGYFIPGMVYSAIVAPIYNSIL